jgi:hypothetical protein
MNPNLQFAKKLYSNVNQQNIKELIEIVANWRFIFINKLNEFCEPAQLFNNTLFINCNSNAMIDLLSYKQLITNSINCFFHHNVVNTIVFRPNF